MSARVVTRAIGLLQLGCLVLAVSRAAAQGPERLTGSDVSPGVWGVVVVPEGRGPHPGVVVLHGAAGWHAVYAEFARSLADSGFVTLALDYYAETGGAPAGSDEKLDKWPRWKATVHNAVDYLRALPSVSGELVGLLGFSRGAFLAVSAASSATGVNAVVDFFGGGGGGTDSLEQEVRGLPPVLILHGDADDVVPVRFAQNLRDAIVAEGGEVEMHLYPGMGHGFNRPGAVTYSDAAAQDSFRHVIEFFGHHLRQ